MNGSLYASTHSSHSSSSMFDTTEEVHTASSSSAPEPYMAPEIPERLYFTVNLLIFIASVFGNVLSVGAFIKASSHLYPWFINLLAADIIKTVLCMPFSLYILYNHETYRISGNETPGLCTAQGGIFLGCLLVSLISNMAISIDRVLAITYPMTYSEMQRKGRPLLLVLSTWVPVLIIVMLSMFQPRVYAYRPFITTCTLEMHDLLVELNVQGDLHVKLITTTIYSILFGVPIVVVCFNCIFVPMKLYKKCRRPTTSEGIVARSQSPNVRCVRQADSIASNTTHVLRLGPTSVDQEGTVICNGAKLSNASQITIEQTVNTEELECREDDKMMMLHDNSLHPPAMKNRGVRSRREKLQRRAGFTMILVAITFLACHLGLFVHWALWETGYNGARCTLAKTHRPQWNYGLCVFFQTMVVTMVYFNTPCNVIIYYYRCSYLRIILKMQLMKLVNRPSGAFREAFELK